MSFLQQNGMQYFRHFNRKGAFPSLAAYPSQLRFSKTPAMHVTLVAKLRAPFSVLAARAIPSAATTRDWPSASDSVDDMQYLYDAYARGGALRIKWYEAEDPGFITVISPGGPPGPGWRRTARPS